MIGAEASTAEEQDNDKLSALYKEQDEIIRFIQNQEGSLKQRVQRLAQIMKERINLADPDFDPSFTISQISTEIKRLFRKPEIGLAIQAENVDHYLDTEFKNSNLARDIMYLEDGRSLYGRSDIEIIKEIGADIHLLKEKINSVTSHQDLEILVRNK